MKQRKQCDLLIQGGHVIDPANEISTICDVAISAGKIVGVKKNLPFIAAKTIDATGLFVTPGLIDMHCHCYPFFPFSQDSLPNLHPNAHMLQNGVTTAVDAGTCGTEDFLAFQQEIIETSTVRVLAFLNIASGGMVHMDTEQQPSCLCPKKTAEMAKAHPSHIVGIKTAHYWVGKPFDASHTPWLSVDAALDAASQSNLPCMVDFQPNLPQRTYPELLQKLRRGDIHTHVYAQQFPILDENKTVNIFLRQARARGIYFDLGHGAGSFWFRNAVPALEQGFAPDTLSTDLYLDNVAGPVVGLLHIMSKYWNMGMSIEEIILRTTMMPARIINRPQLGTLSVGACADVALLQPINGPVHFSDSGHASIKGSTRLTCMLTVRAGRMAYNPYAFGMPHWKDASQAYWQAPGKLEE